MSRFRVSKTILEETRELLADLGREGLEAAVVWIARRPATPESDVEIVLAYQPPQIALRDEDGVAVTLPEFAVTELVASLPDDMFIPVRLHTHPDRAYHSSQDGTNMLISHRGAVSIVVPHFAREPLDLGRCSINELDEGHTWRELTHQEVEERFIVT